MALPNPSSEAFDFVAAVARAYACLLKAPSVHHETALGGRIFYAGELDGEGRALVVAANIAGAATLAATLDRAAQRQALRDGVADFIVNNLDEALRILKNQLRKRETVSVCVVLPPSDVEFEMKERGVSPDLLRGDVITGRGDEAQNEMASSDAPALVTWRAESALPKDLADLDEIALACLDSADWQSRRWLRLAPRYLGRLAQGLRLLDTNRGFAARFAEQLRNRAARGEITFAFEIQSTSQGGNDQFRFNPNSH